MRGRRAGTAASVQRLRIQPRVASHSRMYVCMYDRGANVTCNKENKTLSGWSVRAAYSGDTCCENQPTELNFRQLKIFDKNEAEMR